MGSKRALLHQAVLPLRSVNIGIRQNHLIIRAFRYLPPTADREPSPRDHSQAAPRSAPWAGRGAKALGPVFLSCLLGRSALLMLPGTAQPQLQK